MHRHHNLRNFDAGGGGEDRGWDDANPQGGSTVIDAAIIRTRTANFAFASEHSLSPTLNYESDLLPKLTFR